MDLKKMGRYCQRFRKRHLKMTQTEFGKLVGYSDKTISAFERGRVNNARLLLEYIELGFDVRGLFYGTFTNNDWLNNL